MPTLYTRCNDKCLTPGRISPVRGVGGAAEERRKVGQPFDHENNRKELVTRLSTFASCCRLATNKFQHANTVFDKDIPFTGFLVATGCCLVWWREGEREREREREKRGSALVQCNQESHTMKRTSPTKSGCVHCVKTFPASTSFPQLRKLHGRSTGTQLPHVCGHSGESHLAIACLS